MLQPRISKMRTTAPVLPAPEGNWPTSIALESTGATIQCNICSTNVAVDALMASTAACRKTRLCKVEANCRCTATEEGLRDAKGTETDGERLPVQGRLCLGGGNCDKSRCFRTFQLCFKFHAQPTTLLLNEDPDQLCDATCLKELGTGKLPFRIYSAALLL